MSLSWYPRYMGDYSKDTRDLSLLEHGAYTLLLDYYYSTGGLPSNAQAMLPAMPDHSRLYRICSAITKDEQKAVDNVINTFFHLKNGDYRHKRADKVIEEQREKHEKRVAAGKKGGASNASSKAISNASSNAEASQNQTQNKDIPPLPPKKENGVLNSFSEKGGFEILDHISPEGIIAAKSNAPGWDIYYLMQIYNDGRKERGIPDHPEKAFIAWCKKYTKGKRP